MLYLSEGWQPTHGGELVLVPFPLAPVAVPPVAATLALFSSTLTPHRVAPSSAPRCALSLWFAGAPEFPFPRSLPAWAAHPSLAFLRLPSNARVLCKVLHAREWADSLTDAFGRGDDAVAAAAVRAASELHWREVERLRAALPPHLVALMEGTLPLTPPLQPVEGGGGEGERGERAP